ncbi:RNA-directed DNA polymerase, eukaryota [Tanacetum coccineum]|uniref:RNA-directed DNA polymerase, eukaryota n=1 Tax=Tanacetum coccineum TaxID=301880 RepID=A0ABQ4WB74_9ASTR
MLNKKRNNLSIRGVLVDGVWVDEPKDVKKEFFDYFSKRFSKPGNRRAKICMEFPNRLNSDQIHDLEAEVSKDEVKRAVWECGTDKAPGPDGFTFGFFRHFWYLVEKDVIDAIPDANVVKDFRPISLIGSLYKIIAKILTNRLVNVLGGLVNEVQSAFVANRQILDGPFIINELFQWCKSKKKQTLIFKVDFEKAYDSVRWDFLDEVLSKFGFGEKWRKWIQCCLHSSRGSIIINGSPTDEFIFGKGLKQGDPLSPFLFILIMESLHLSFQRVVDEGLFHGIKLHDTVNISHLFYADDAVFVGQWSDRNISTLTYVLECFYLASGLKINMSKSKIMGIHVNNDNVNRAAENLGCLVLKAPFMYLGSTVGGDMHRLSRWKDTIDRVRRRLSKWKMKMLSIGGRLTLVKSVLGSMPIFHMSLFKVPSGILKVLESIRSHFFNGHDISSKKVSWVNWNKVIASKDKGGLGVSSLYALNRGLLFKWIWRFLTQGSSLWAKVIKAIHGVDGNLGSNSKGGMKSCWSSIVTEVNALANKGIDLMQFLRIKMGNGDSIRLWEDPWHEGGILKFRYPRVIRAPMADRWMWTRNTSGEFTVASVRQFIDDKICIGGDHKTTWIRFIPNKIRSKRNKKIPSNLEGFVLSTNSKVKNTVTKDGDMGSVMSKNGNDLDFNSSRRDNVEREYSISRDASVKRDGYGDKQKDDEGLVEDLNGAQFPSINSTPKNYLGEKNKSGNENNKRLDDNVKSGDRKEDKTVKDNTGFLRYANVVNINKVENKLFVIETEKNENGVDIVMLNDEIIEQGVDEVIKNGPWMVNNKPLFVQEWRVGMNLDRTEPSKLPVWVKMYNIPMEQELLKLNVSVALAMNELKSEIVVFGHNDAKCLKKVKDNNERKNATVNAPVESEFILVQNRRVNHVRNFVHNRWNGQRGGYVNQRFANNQKGYQGARDNTIRGEYMKKQNVTPENHSTNDANKDNIKGKEKCNNGDNGESSGSGNSMQSNGTHIRRKEAEIGFTLVELMTDGSNLAPSIEMRKVVDEFMYKENEGILGDNKDWNLEMRRCYRDRKELLMQLKRMIKRIM